MKTTCKPGLPDCFSSQPVPWNAHEDVGADSENVIGFSFCVTNYPDLVASKVPPNTVAETTPISSFFYHISEAPNSGSSWLWSLPRGLKSWLTSVAKPSCPVKGQGWQWPPHSVSIVGTTQIPATCEYRPWVLDGRELQATLTFQSLPSGPPSGGPVIFRVARAQTPSSPCKTLLTCKRVVSHRKVGRRCQSREQRGWIFWNEFGGWCVCAQNDWPLKRSQEMTERPSAFLFYNWIELRGQYDVGGHNSIVDCW